ncbi:FAS1-like dehydratase domain-containing protein [Qipengyuania marisflavi]|uniref:N-terminal of MaoC-like dehydratase domain-containing protein n=1 Tax=Qipengyuania marisflavi TaxID=2486356 RepID=A0A5S3P5P6_9SPHN|nr:MaoC family dehydratase N-terminal domain-containing protein [Qipengyuania marisflavi]TMM48362.1 hypothetical protein FEV51_08775 [Qipengyuania marisflavi]
MAGKWDDWIGRETRSTDLLSAELAARWCATFDRTVPEAEEMPQGVHFCLCTPDAATLELGEDGHPARDDGPGSFLPPIPLPRRMWAASTINFHTPLRIGAQVERVSRVAAITEKSGGSGPLVFVEVANEMRANGTRVVREQQTLVYREAAAANAALVPPAPGNAIFDPAEWDAHRVLTPDPRLLFRYSALTFNTHRIHYDAPYAAQTERYRGLVVHGPLTASVLLQLAAQQVGENRLTSFTFRGVSPAIAGEPLHLVLRENQGALDLAAFAADGRQVTKAQAALG